MLYQYSFRHHRHHTAPKVTRTVTYESNLSNLSSNTLNLWYTSTVKVYIRDRHVMLVCPITGCDQTTDAVVVSV